MQVFGKFWVIANGLGNTLTSRSMIVGGHSTIVSTGSDLHLVRICIIAAVS